VLGDEELELVVLEDEELGSAVPEDEELELVVLEDEELGSVVLEDEELELVVLEDDVLEVGELVVEVVVGLVEVELVDGFVEVEEVLVEVEEILVEVEVLVDVEEVFVDVEEVFVDVEEVLTEDVVFVDVDAFALPIIEEVVTTFGVLVVLTVATPDWPSHTVSHSDWGVTSIHTKMAPSEPKFTMVNRINY
jgi:hypothetical protein